MEGEKKVKVNGMNVKCLGYYGYNNHYYVTLFNDDSGQYLGELVDCQLHDSNFQKRLETFVNSLVEVPCPN